MDVRGLVLAAGVGLERVPLPHALLLDGVELRGNNIFGGSASRHDAVDGVRAAPNSRQGRRTTPPRRRRDRVQVARSRNGQRLTKAEGKKRTPRKNGNVQFAHEVRRRDGIDVFARHLEDGAVDAEVDGLLVLGIVFSEGQRKGLAPRRVQTFLDAL